MTNFRNNLSRVLAGLSRGHAHAPLAGWPESDRK